MRLSLTSASLLSLSLLFSSASAGPTRGAQSVEERSTAPVVAELHGRKLPPLSPGALEELSKRSADDFQVFHNDLNVVRAIQDSNGDPELLDEIRKRGAAITGEVKRCTASHCLCITFDDG